MGRQKLSIAKEGLLIKVREKDIDRYLSVIKKRASDHLTGSRWAVRSYR